MRLGGEERLEELVACSRRDADAGVAHGEVDTTAALGPRGAHAHRAVPPSIASTPLLSRLTSTWVIWSRSRSARRLGRHVDLEVDAAPSGDRRRPRSRPPAATSVAHGDALGSAPCSAGRSRAGRRRSSCSGRACSTIELAGRCPGRRRRLPLSFLPGSARTAGRAERVVHLVGDAGGQLAHARQLLGVDECRWTSRSSFDGPELGAPCSACSMLYGRHISLLGQAARWRPPSRGRSG